MSIDDSDGPEMPMHTTDDEATVFPSGHTYTDNYNEGNWTRSVASRSGHTKVGKRKV